jgi:hypothetical protein
VSPCNDLDPPNNFYSEEEKKGCNTDTFSLIDIGLIYNDVWAYKLCNPNEELQTVTRTYKVSSNPDVYVTNSTVEVVPRERDFDDACKNSGWVLWHPGDKQGGKSSLHSRAYVLQCLLECRR